MNDEIIDVENDPEITPEVTPDTDPDVGAGAKVCIPIPESLRGDLKDGDPFEGPISGTVITKDGVLSVDVNTLNGETVDSYPEDQDEESAYTGKEENVADMDSGDALDKFMKGRKVTQ